RTAQPSPREPTAVRHWKLAASLTPTQTHSDPHTRENRRAQRAHRCSTDVVRLVEQILRSREHLDSVTKPPRHKPVKHEERIERQQVLIVVKLFASCATLKRQRDDRRI